MNILYVAFKDFAKLHFGGNKKVINACRALEQAGHTVTLLGRRKNKVVTVTTDGVCTPIADIPKNIIGKLQPLTDKNTQMTVVEKFVADKQYDFCYVRYDLCTRQFVRLLKAIKRVCPKVFLEIPTYPYDKEYLGKLNKLRMWYDNLTADGMKGVVDKVISFYPVENNSFHGIDCLLVPNGFDFGEVEIIKQDEVPEVIDIAAVSSMRIWHAYERMIEGMHLYYENGGKRDVRLHLVGDGREGGKYAELTRKYGLEKQVIFHGALHGEGLDALLESCPIGIDSLGRHRTGISVLSSLKSREYGAKGIPFINSCEIDIVDDTFPYMLKVPADESPVDVQAVVDFYDRIFAGGSRIEVAKKVRAYIEPRSNMQAVMEQILAAM